jgi:hypothetical protein
MISSSPRLTGWDIEFSAHPASISLGPSLPTHPLLDYRDHNNYILDPQAYDQSLTPLDPCLWPEDTSG